MLARAFVTGPAEILYRTERIGQAIDLLPFTATHICEPKFIGVGANGKTEWIAQADGNHKIVGLVAADQGVIGRRADHSAGDIEPQYRAVKVQPITAG